ncbi:MULTISPECIES: AAA family ATPase [Crocosphaera]|uniref:AAA family ATPase n=1 Tax=Crocosphaera TaxID=263510 RepID=UPI00257E9476|nr:AAA family ATPase [Crocosphaera sp.]MCH2244681.1 AAA family ATPase [Crocosphaera sp.]NQZ63925.1 AAA family ATPase [Crocosphaera sp.]
MTEVHPEFSNKNERSENDLFLPFTYEEILKKIGKDKSRLVDLIVPVTQFEKQIIQVVLDIENAGYLLFLYGVSGVGKSTFISSLKFQKHIPIQSIVSIDASELDYENKSDIKLKQLLKQIKKEARDFFSENNQSNDKLCIVIDYLENLNDEDNNNVKAFFRDLNGLLRKYPILIIWPVTVREDLENMQEFAKSFSSTMFHRIRPAINFTGPPLDEYPNIAKKTIMFFNEGKSCYEFQLTDNDLENLKKGYEKKAQEKHLIRDYLKDIRSLWEERTDYISGIVKNVPKPTEVWFIFSYPEAEDIVARFAKQTPDIINEMWNADYKSLFVYISDNNQRKADWKPQRLTLALSSRMLTTKIMYLPTNALVSCIAAYAKDAEIPIPKEDLLNRDKYNILQHWCIKSNAKKTLSTTPLYLQLSGVSITGGKRKSGRVEKGLKNATPAFEKINKDISDKKISDQKFNKAVCLALQDVFNNSEHNLDFVAEKPHPHLTNIRPDILVDTNDKLVCLEFCYTNNKTPGNMADYVLRKLNQYMKQLEDNFEIPKDLLS